MADCGVTGLISIAMNLLSAGTACAVNNHWLETEYCIVGHVLQTSEYHVLRLGATAYMPIAFTTYLPFAHLAPVLSLDGNGRELCRAKAERKAEGNFEGIADGKAANYGLCL